MERRQARYYWIVALVVVVIAAPLMVAPRGAAAAEYTGSVRTTGGTAPRMGNAAPLLASCYGSAQTSTRSFTAQAWTGWYYPTATANCADLNVIVTNYPSNCQVFVDARYYSRAQGRWIDGANDDFWMQPGTWYTPLTALRDGTPIAVNFYPNCTDSSATLRLAS